MADYFVSLTSILRIYDLYKAPWTQYEVLIAAIANEENQ